MRNIRSGSTVLSLFFCAVLLLSASACNVSVSTAHISSLKLGKDQQASTETTKFASGDTIFAVADVSNVPSKVKVTGRLAVENVAGQNVGPIPGLEKTLDMAQSGTATFNFTPPPTGWPAGKYKVEVVMVNDAGEQKDQKSASFDVS